MPNDPVAMTHYCMKCGDYYPAGEFCLCSEPHIIEGIDDGTLRTFASGATRDTAEDKLDYDGFLSPDVLVHFAEYMHANRVQSDGSLRDSDNWQKGIPLDQYMKSAWRHFMNCWESHRNGDIDEDSLHGLLFNVMGYLHEVHNGKSP